MHEATVGRPNEGDGRVEGEVELGCEKRARRGCAGGVKGGKE